jgi:hypothetical protein
MREPIKIKESAVINLEASGDLATFYFSRKARIRRVGIIVTSAADANSKANVEVDTIKFGGTRGSADGGTLVLPASTAIRTVCFERPSASVEVEVGGAVAFQSTAQSTNAMTGIAFVEYSDVYENEANTTGDLAV